jgi:uncharacterized protein YcfJ
MNKQFKMAVAVAALCAAGHAAAQVTFYEGNDFHGRAFTANRSLNNFNANKFNDRVSSVVVEGGRWQVCENMNFGGRCAVLSKGRYASLASISFDNNISSVRPAGKGRHYDNEIAPRAEVQDYAWRRRANESVFQVPVTSVHAVMGAPAERCWVERQQVSEPSHGDRNMGGALAGALIGGVLGHQVGGGSGKDLATIGGAVAGGVIGSNIGRNDGSTTSVQNVRRCEHTASGTPAYWDVSYKFRGLDHRIQMSGEPGTTIAVNRNGEPRQ